MASSTIPVTLKHNSKGKFSIQQMVWHIFELQTAARHGVPPKYNHDLHMSHLSGLLGTAVSSPSATRRGTMSPSSRSALTSTNSAMMSVVYTCSRRQE